MANTQLDAVVRQIRKLRAVEAGDDELITAFSAHRDPTAFAGLVERYGPLVLGVCRRVLRQEQDAEDAFQATFLVLSQRAGTIRKRESLSSWLHGVAFRVAMRARQQATRRRAREAQSKTVPPDDPSWKAAWREVQVVLDEEIQALPEKYRSVFVLCCVEGCPQAEVARRLGIKEGTVWSRLAQARKLLQDRLARRGVALSAVLAATALAAGRAPAVPVTLAAVTVKAATLFATGTLPAGTVAANVLGLAKGVHKTMIPTLKTTALFLLTLGALALGLGVTLHLCHADAHPAAQSQPPAPAPVAPEAKAEAGTVEVGGLVLGTDGKPFAGARLLVWTRTARKRADLSTKATTGDDGHFRLTVTPDELRHGAKLVAVARGHGPDFVQLDAKDKPAELILRLVKDDVPIEGRILSLEGKPLAGVTVAARMLELGDRKEWLEAQKNGFFAVLKPLSPEVVDGQTSGKTDKDGRVHLTGFGRDRLVALAVTGPGIENSDLVVLTDPAPAAQLAEVKGPTFQHAVRPSRPIVGTVRDRKTGKPIAGAHVACPGPSMEWPTALTDEKGHYRIEGAGKSEQYTVTATAMPYFNSAPHDVKDTPGFDAITVDFELDRGLALHGRLLDKATRQPVRGHVRYEPLNGNPYIKDYLDIGKGVFLAEDYGQVAEDGSFTVVGIPGPGVLTAQADDADAYLPVSPGNLRPAFGASLEGNQAVVRIEVDAKDEKTLTCDVFLQPGRSVRCTIVGPDGKPVTGAQAGGMHAVYHAGEDPMRVEGDTFTLAGLSGDEARAVVVVHPEKQLVRLQVIPADQKGPVTVRLEPTGAFVGRIVDADGRPLPGVKVEVAYQFVQTLEGARTTAKLPRAMKYVDSGWRKLLNGENLTDARGRFRIAGLAPGLKYDLRAPGLERRGVTVEPGKENDLGDLK